MSDGENLVLEHLRAIRGTLSEHGERLNRIEFRLAAIEQTPGSMYALSGSDRETLNGIIRRVERIERRLELTDSVWQSARRQRHHSSAAGSHRDPAREERAAPRLA
jgi:hypothetical protein